MSSRASLSSSFSLFLSLSLFLSFIVIPPFLILSSLGTVLAPVLLFLLFAFVFCFSSTWPFIYLYSLGILAMPGARIGLADELVSRFRVAWIDPTAPSKGFRYLYLSPDDFRWLARASVLCAPPSLAQPLDVFFIFFISSFLFFSRIIYLLLSFSHSFFSFLSFFYLVCIYICVCVLYQHPRNTSRANENQAVRAVAVEDGNETRFKIEDIFGVEDGSPTTVLWAFVYIYEPHAFIHTCTFLICAHAPSP